MQTRGKISSIAISFPSRTAVVSFEMTATPEDVEKYKEMDLDITFIEHKEKRSLNANAYFHLLSDKLAQVMKISKAEMKNRLINDYGQVEYLENGQQAVLKSNIEPEIMLKIEYLHTGLIKVGSDGAYWYRVNRGTHTYNTKEMSQLIDGTVQECKDQGIETLSPDKIREMIAAYEREYVKERKSVQG